VNVIEDGNCEGTETEIGMVNRLILVKMNRGYWLKEGN
jgi:hypothetical protein